MPQGTLEDTEDRYWRPPKIDSGFGLDFYVGARINVTLLPTTHVILFNIIVRRVPVHTVSVIPQPSCTMLFPLHDILKFSSY